jgi:transposase-like protein
MVCHQPKARCQCPGTATGIGIEQLPNRLGYLASLAPSHGASWTRALEGQCGVDETYLAITERGKPKSAVGRKSHTTKTLVAIAVEILEPKGFGRIRLRRIPLDSERYLLPFVRDAVALGSTVHTDGSPAYRSLAQQGYLHERHVMSGSSSPAHASMPGVHRVAALVKRWLLGTHHGAVQPDQLDYYLDEFVFRFNRRTSGSRGMLFYRLLQQAVVNEPVTYQDIVERGQTDTYPFDGLARPGGAAVPHREQTKLSGQRSPAR